MVKIIHCIKVGPNSVLGDFELACIESWKKVYPDFEIKYWTDRELLPYISRCVNALSSYNNGAYAFAMDYVKLEILYEFGGIYMDTDVFCVNRVPDEVFAKAFTTWGDGGFEYWTENGTVCYCEPNDPLYKEFIDLYRSFGEYPEFKTDNTIIENVIRSKGLDYSDRLNCTQTDQFLKEINVYNCRQYGCYDFMQSIMRLPEKGKPVYFVHCRTVSWAAYDGENIQMYYMFINEETTENEIYKAVETFLNMEVSGVYPALLVLAMNCISEKANKYSVMLHYKLSGSADKRFCLFPIGNNLDEDTRQAALADFISKRYNNIKFCRDISVGNYTGVLNV